MDAATHTPERSPSKRMATITQAQKQALIDNLQLEITERARRLRAQYAEQAQHLRSRLESRVNRIPKALRKRKLQDLLDEFAEKEREKEEPAQTIGGRDEVKAVENNARGLKRSSDQLAAHDTDDKENVPTSSYQQAEDLPNPKKRAKTTAATTIKASRKVVPSTVLSPKSHNSRTLPRSPFKSATANEKQHQPSIRPVSPVKPSITAVPAGKRTASRAATAPKRGGAGQANVEGRENEAETGRSSEASNSSAGTTIVRKPAVAAGGRKAKAAPASTTAAGAKKVTGKAAVGKAKTAAAAKKENVPPVAPVGGGRSLRKRN